MVCQFQNQRPQINWKNFERIKKGMTQDEVENILGAPPGDYSTEPGITLSLPKTI
jgi:hypothetical protein